MHAQQLYWQPWWTVCQSVYVCVCLLLWIEIAASAGREHDKVGELLRGRQAAVREEEEGKWEHEESSQRFEWETFVGRQSDLNVGYEEVKTKTSDYTL